MKIRLMNIITYVLYIALFKIYLIPQYIQQTYKVILIGFVLIYLLRYVSIDKFLNASLPLVIIIFFSSFMAYLAGDLGFQSVLNSLLHGICIWSIYTFFYYSAKRNKLENIIKNIYNITFIYCIISLISIFLLGRSAEGTAIVYIFGDKFDTSYFFIMLTSLYHVKNNRKINTRKHYSFVFLALALFTIFISFWIHCTTAGVASILMLILSILSKKIKRLFMSEKVILMSMGLAAFIIRIIDSIIENQYIQYLVVDILGKNINLTGRLKIYDNLDYIVSRKPIMGYGYGSRVVEQVVGYGNAQNGLFHLIIEFGLTGMFVFIWMVVYCIRKSAKTVDYWGLYLLLFAMIICSITEISYNYMFFIAVFLLRWTEKEQFRIR